METATPDRVWQLFEEVSRQFRETDRRFQETDRRFQETDRRFQETDRRFQETDRKFQETSRIIQELGVRFQETERMVKEQSRQISGLGDKFGYFTEGLAFPSLENILMQRFGMETVNPRVRVRRHGRVQEYDVLAWSNGETNTVMVVEIKSRVRREAIDQLAEQVRTLFEMIPELAGKRRIGILAGVDWDPGVEEEAQRLGFYTARIRDDIFELTTPDDFAPTVW